MFVVGMETLLMLCLASILLSQSNVLDLRYKCNQGGPLIGLGGLCYSLKDSSYLLGAVSIFLENRGEKFQFMSEEILVTKSFGSVYQGRQD